LQQLDEKRGRESAEVAALPASARLDAGLPSEGDVSREQALDPLHHIFHALGAGLTAASGGTPSAYVNRGDVLRRERAQGLAERLGLKAEDRSNAAAAEQEAAQAAHAADVAERGLGLRERQTSAAERTAESTAAQRAASMAHTQLLDQQTAEQRAAMERVDSSESQSARRAWEAGVERLPAGMRDRMESVISPEELATMNATQLEGPLRMLERISVGARGSGGGGGSADRRPSLEAAARGLEMSPEGIAAMSTSELAAAVRTAEQQASQQRRAQSARAGDEEGRMVVYGDAEGAPVTADPRTFGSPAALNNYQEGLATAGDTSTSLAELDRVYRAAVGSGSALERAQAWARFQVSGEIEQPIGMLMGAVTEMARTGVINPGAEAARIRGMLPDPSNFGQMSYDQFQSRMRQFRSALSAQITQRAHMHGIAQPDIDRMLRTIVGGGFGGSSRPRSEARSAPQAGPSTPSAPTGDMVRMQLPDGRRVRIPAAGVARARELGATEL
jgi:hypothetical protein